ncbi:hypothetical protein [Streptomyces echinatus]|uniref:hypothetical protein n=1 Tax=Streptomyces echinatus TaxID=67293 RepID=UPI003CD08EAA
MTRPVNHLLLKATNTGTQPCYAYGAPYLRAGADAQAAVAWNDSTVPQAGGHPRSGESRLRGHHDLHARGQRRPYGEDARCALLQPGDERLGRRREDAATAPRAEPTSTAPQRSPTGRTTSTTRSSTDVQRDSERLEACFGIRTARGPGGEFPAFGP